MCLGLALGTVAVGFQLWAVWGQCASRCLQESPQRPLRWSCRCSLHPLPFFSGEDAAAVTVCDNTLSKLRLGTSAETEGPGPWNGTQPVCCDVMSLTNITLSTGNQMQGSPSLGNVQDREIHTDRT